MDENGGDPMETEMSDGEETGKCLSIFVEEGSVESYRYYLARRTLLEMLRDRGYDISDSKFELTLPQFRELHGQSINVDLLRFSASHASDSQDKITDLLFKITRDVLKPEHRVITDNGKEKLLKKKLPRMSQKDPIAQNYAPEKGKVTEVTNQQSFSQIPTFNSQPFPDSQDIHDTQPPKSFPDSQPIPNTQPPIIVSMPKSQSLRPKKNVKNKRIKRKGKRPITKTTPIVVPPQHWSWSEEAALARAWIYVFEDRNTSNSQKFDSFWDRITLQFHSVMGKGEYRTKHQLSTKFHEMLKRTVKFCGIYENFLTNRKRGWNDTDILSKAHEQYKNDEGTSFTHLPVWRIVKDDPKWAILLELIEKVGGGSKRSKTSEDNDYVSHAFDARTNIDLNVEENDDPILSQVEPTHFMGTDKAKGATLEENDEPILSQVEPTHSMGRDKAKGATLEENDDPILSQVEPTHSMGRDKAKGATLEENDDPILSQVEPTRSIGRDKTKEATEMGLSSSSFVDTLAVKFDFFNTNYFEIEKQKIELKKRMIDENVRAEDWKILTGDTSNLPKHIRIAAEALRDNVVKKYNPNIKPFFKLEQQTISSILTKFHENRSEFKYRPSPLQTTRIHRKTHFSSMDENGGDAMETEMSNGGGGGGGGTGKCLSGFVDEGSVESHRYYLARRTLLEMLRDRGYDISDSEIELTLPQFRDLHGQHIDVDRLRISASHASDSQDKILAVFCGTGVVKVNVIRWIATQIMNKQSLNRLIIVVQSHITNQAMKAVELFPFKVEMFQITDLLVNITKHVLKPKHRVISDIEKEKLLKKFNLTEKQLPRMSQKDAIAQYYALEKGQVIEVTYNGEITGLHVTYRCIW
ncbi:hypothetical protein SSX86_023782 [Deinandra increscens subsp. villosa]|uniref:DNA-directed RNA polymerase V subunit 5A n=1 Tax=Deinandra increscens subsp. villosa TaxID=3103831 RepID=A0AAP0CI37_9ASTR